MNGLLNDLASQCQVKEGNAAASYSSGANVGSAIDMTGGTQPTDGRCALLGQVGATTGTVVFQVSESATSGGSYTDISGATLSFTATDDNTAQVISFSRSLRYLKVTATCGANTTLLSSTVLGQYKQF